MKLPELASILSGLLEKLSAFVSDRSAMAQSLLDAALQAKADAEKIAEVEAELTRLKDEDAATDAGQAEAIMAAVSSEYEGRIKAAEDALTETIADQEAATATIATVVDAIAQLLP